MEQFRAYSPEDIILSNLKETSARHGRIFEQELAHLAELAKELIESQADKTEMLSALPDFRLPSEPLHDKTHLLQNGEILKKLEKIHTTEKRLLLCDEIRKLLRAEPSEFLSDTEKTILHTTLRIEYQKSSFTDTAFLQFSPLFETPRASYAHSFHAACEDVYNDVCEYCILPIENTTEGRLIGFTKLIDRFGLKIAATCDVRGTDGARVTRFALLCKNVSLFPSGDTEKERFLEISFLPDRDPTVAQLLVAAELCGLSLCKIHSIPHSEHAKDCLFHAVFRTNDASLPTFLLYLTMEVPQYSLIGIYPHLSSQSM